MKRFLLISLVAVSAAFSAAQSRSSFQIANSFTGITITQLNSLTWDVQLSAAPTVVYLNQTYTVTELFGFWALDNDNDMSATGTSFAQWNYSQSYSGLGGIAGFKTNPNQGIVPGGSQTFSLSSLNGTVENTGVHVRFAEFLPGGGNTIYLETPPASTPEPTTLAALALGGVALLRRRKRS